VKALRHILSLVIHPYRRLYLTPRGWIFCAITVGMGLVATNTGHNLFHLTFGFLLGTVVVSGILSETVLRRIKVEHHVPHEVTARVPFPILVDVRNTHARRTVYSVDISARCDFSPVRKVAYLASLAPGAEKKISYFVQVEKRGLYHFRWLRLSTRFPFGFFEKVRLIPLPDSFLAYPGNAKVPPLNPWVAGKDQNGSRKTRSGEEVLSLRPALPDDDHRLVHWPTSARTNQLMVKELADQIQHPRPFFFDNRGAPGPKFEHAVERAASLLRALAKGGVAVNFATWEEHFQPSANGREIKAALRHLALVAPVQDAAGAGFQRWHAQVAREHGGVFLQGNLPPPRTLPRCEIVPL
jgi:uncharacterized protein (DUF58 family)